MKIYQNYFLLFILMLFSACDMSNEIHVSPHGNDRGTGSISNPFKTLKRARDEVRIKTSEMSNGVLNVVLHEGTYSITEPLTFTSNDAVNENVKVIWKAAPGEKPVISGAISGTVKYSDQVCKVNFASSDKLFDIYVNEKRATRARTPNVDFFRFENVKEKVLVRGEGRVPQKAIQTLTFPKIAAAPMQQLTDYQLGKVRFHAFFKWDNTIRYISGKAEKNGSYFIEGSGMKPWNRMGKGTRFFLENYKEALDAPGEWFASEGVVKYIPEKGETVTDQDIMMPVAEKLLVIKGKSEKKVRNIIFDGISFRYTNYNLPEVGFAPAQAASTVDAAVMLDNAEGVEFLNCEFAHTGQHGVWFRKGVTNCLMQKCHLHDLGAGGIRIGEVAVSNDSLEMTGNITIENCIVQSGGYNFPSAVGVWIGQSGNNNIIHNDIADFRYTGVSVGWIWGYAHSPAKNNKIKHNRIHHIGWSLLSDMSGVYTLGVSEGTEVSNNVVHDIHAYSYGGWGLYTDEGSSFIKMENNLVYNTKTGGFHQHYGKENVISNNIFAFARMYQVQATRVEKHLSFTFKNNIVVGNEGVMLAGPWKKIKLNMDSNCYWYSDKKPFDFVGSTFKDWKKETGHDKNSIVSDPGTIDLPNGTYKLNEGIAHKIGFQLFDPNETGVYGDEKWKQKAKLSATIINEFENAVKENMIKK